MTSSGGSLLQRAFFFGRNTSVSTVLDLREATSISNAYIPTPRNISRRPPNLNFKHSERNQRIIPPYLFLADLDGLLLQRADILHAALREQGDAEQQVPASGAIVIGLFIGFLQMWQTVPLVAERYPQLGRRLL
jgi:hypothetical protein